MKKSFYEILEMNPVIAAIKDPQGLEACCRNDDIKVVFILYGDICSVGEIVDAVKEAGKVAMVHIDLIAGLSGKEMAVDFIHRSTACDGVISTKPALIRRARELGMYTTLRVFVLDSLSIENITNQVTVGKPDSIEILPGLMPKVITRVAKLVRLPVITGGLISEKEDVVAALDAGAMSVSTTNPKMWQI